MEPTAEQVEAYRRDGFVVVEEFLPREEVERVRARWERLFKHEWETGVAPDEVNYTPGVTPGNVTRQLCNAWRADRVVAATTLARRNAGFAARLAGLPGLRINQDNLIWKPPSGKALLVHQDGSYLDWLEPPNMVTCWMALDDTSADTGTICYARGSHHWPKVPVGGRFHAPDDWLSYVREVMPAGAELDLVPIEVPAGGAAFHDAWVFHGSPANDRADAERRAVISHLMAADTRWNPAASHPVYSRYRRPGETEMDEAFFPVLWAEDGYRTPWVDAYVADARP
ncbi:MAG TPA: phytanoyl-CoA dioxygenase family protein [Actinomycetes bacterium]|nr:phytanoyl-CoA dioxygenase family protein [Actinomycetes bacterium]